MARKRNGPTTPLARLFDDAALSAFAEKAVKQDGLLDPLSVPSVIEPARYRKTPEALKSKSASTASTTADAGTQVLTGVFYGRLSIPKQGLNFGSWAVGQKEIYAKLRAQHASEDSGIFLDDGISGAKINDLAERDACTAHILRHGIRILFCEAVDRIGRNHIDVLKWVDKLRRHKVRLITYRTGEPHRILIAMLAILAEHERDKMSERVRESRPRHIAGGRVLGLHPYGFRVDKNTDRLVVYEPEARVVRLIYDLYGKTYAGAAQICRILEEMGIPAPMGGTKWHPVILLGYRVQYNDGMVRRVNGLLCRRAYVGLRETSILTTGVDREGNLTRDYTNHEDWQRRPCPEIVKQEVYDLVQGRLAALDYQAGAGDYLMSGLTFCGLCNGPMIVASSNRSAINHWGVSPRLRCRASLSGECQHKESYAVIEVQSGVVEVLLTLMDDRALASKYRTAFGSARLEPLGDPADMRSEEADLTAVIERLIKAQAATPSAADDYAKQINELVRKRTKLRARLVKIDELRAAPTTVKPKEAAAALKVFLRENLPKNLNGILDEKLAHAVQAFRDLFVGLTLSPAPGRSRFVFRCETVLGSVTGAAFVRHQRINDTHSKVIAAFRTARGGIRHRDVLAHCSTLKRGRVKASMKALLEYGVIERCGEPAKGLMRLAVPIAGDGPWVLVRQEVKLRGVPETVKNVRVVQGGLSPAPALTGRAARGSPSSAARAA